MLDKIFEIDYNRLIGQNVPADWQQPKFILWLRGLISPAKILHDQFTRYRRANLYTLAHNGQVCYLRKVLNDSFDPIERRIYITDGSKYQPEYIYSSAEQQPRYLGTIYLREADDYADTGVDFRVIVPVGFDLTAVIHQMKAQIDFYRLASKRYKIEFHE